MKCVKITHFVQYKSYKIVTYSMQNTHESVYVYTCSDPNM